MQLAGARLRNLVTSGLGVLCLSILLSLIPVHLRESTAAQEGAPLTADVNDKIYLPFVQMPPPALTATPIWVSDQVMGQHAVGLFRHRFTLSQPVVNAELAIFADTRYEIWLDGQWIGRGPARFTLQTREYDIYSLNNLSEGEHTIAVLVQWAPNTRRSESVRPMLQARLRGSVNNQWQTFAETGPHWRAIASEAWQQQAAPVHAWELIGPTELLDLRRLPSAWHTRAFNEQNWPQAIQQVSHRNTSQPRSIPHLAQEAVPVQVRESGLLSPGFRIAELPLAAQGQYAATFQTPNETTFVLETLRRAHPESTIDETVSVSLNDNLLTWQARPERHPDIYQATMTLPAGNHTLTIEGASDDDWTFSLSQEHSDLIEWPRRQGMHAGRRLLLSEQEVVPDAVTVSPTTDHGINLLFHRAPAYVVLDLGRVVHGRFTATVSGPAGTLVDVGWDERLWHNSKPLPFPGSLHWQWNQSDSWVLDGTSRRVWNLDTRSGRYLLLAVWGDGPVEMRDLRIDEERYPTARRGRFDSSNDRLDRIWQVGINTFTANMTDAYADPWRERGQWWGDAYVVDHINRVALGDSKVLRRGLLMMAEQSRQDGTLPPLVPSDSTSIMHDYAMLWTQSLHEYWLTTGHTDVTRDVYPVLRAFLDYLETRRDPDSGLLAIPEGHWSQTALISWASPWCNRYGQSTPLNALYYDTLLDAAALTDSIGHHSEANQLAQTAEQVRQAINASLYQPATGSYLGSTGLPEYCAPSPQAQAWALAYDVVPESEQQRVADTLLTLIADDPVEPGIELYGTYWVLEGLARSGHISEGIDLIELIYGRLLDLNATTWWEHLNANLYYYASLSHGWSASPTWFLTTHVLGAQQTGPETWRVRPGLADLSEVQGVLPLPAGDLSVHWMNHCEQPFRLEITAPANTSGTIVLPIFQEDMTLTFNETLVWQDGRALIDTVTKQDGEIVLSVEEGGTYILEATRAPHQCMRRMPGW